MYVKNKFQSYHIDLYIKQQVLQMKLIVTLDFLANFKVYKVVSGMIKWLLLSKKYGQEFTFK